MQSTLVSHLRSPGEHFQEPPVESEEKTLLLPSKLNERLQYFYCWETAGR